LNYWRGKDVVLRLSPEGKQALSGAYDTEFVKVFVQWADESGLWVVRDRQESGEISVLLIKWPFFETAQLDVMMPEPVPSKTVGFHRQG
jgi:hypothetical protein